MISTEAFMDIIALKKQGHSIRYIARKLRPPQEDGQETSGSQYLPHLSPLNEGTLRP